MLNSSSKFSYLHDCKWLIVNQLNHFRWSATHEAKSLVYNLVFWWTSIRKLRKCSLWKGRTSRKMVVINRVKFSKIFKDVNRHCSCTLFVDNKIVWPFTSHQIMCETLCNLIALYCNLNLRLCFHPYWWSFSLFFFQVHQSDQLYAIRPCSWSAYL